MWFIDTSHLIALFSPKDNFHAQATALQQRVQAERIALVTTEQVIFEMGAAFSRVPMRGTGSRIIYALMHDPQIEIAQTSTTHRQSAIEQFEQHHDKDWSLCDCMSFVVMRQWGISEALSADHHFEQAGFAALLRNVAVSL